VDPVAASPEEIKDASREFIALIEDDAISAKEHMQRLRRSLDRLALLQHDVSYTFDERDYPDAPRKDYNAMRQLVSPHFPDLGYYNVPSCVTQEIAQTGIDVGDAIDDIADIAIELCEVLWRFNHTSIDDALWYFEFSSSRIGSITFANSSCACSGSVPAMKMRSNQAMDPTTGAQPDFHMTKQRSF
jgi:hypothetical protein